MLTAAKTAAEKAAEKAEVKGYFETTGFERWNRIYSTSDDVNKVQRNIRIGHQKTVDNVLAWLQEQGGLESRSFCDAGCGVGSLTLPLAQLGAGSIAASDLSAAMVQEAQRRAGDLGIKPDQISFLASDLESLHAAAGSAQGDRPAVPGPQQDHPGLHPAGGRHCGRRRGRRLRAQAPQPQPGSLLLLQAALL
jgi:SAM-dependent methyltransferase